MSEFDLFKELSELDEELVMAPRKHVSLGMNFWLSILAANITSFLPDIPPLLSILAYLGVFALLYAAFRFGVEFVRVPDAQLGYLAFGWLTMGQLLCLPLMAAGLWLLCRTPQEQAAVEPAAAPRKGKSARKR